MLFVLSLLILLFWTLVGIDFIWGVGFIIPCLSFPRKRESSAIGSPIKSFGDDQIPRVSVIFSARNEGNSIVPALRSMLSQNYPNYEVIAVNDRSTDNTYSQMKTVSDSRLTILNIQTLPERWLGKNHALYQAAQKATGEWFLFTDADVVFHPETLNSVIAFGENQKVDHVALIPKMITKGFWEKIYTVCFGLGFFMYFRPWKASDPKSKRHMGIGAFNLIRRKAYEAFGGHKHFSLNVLDDMELGRQVKQAGFKQAVVFGPDLVSVRWLEGWEGILKSLEKNGFAGVNYNLGILAGLTLLCVLFNVLPFILIWAGGLTQVFSIITLALIFLVYWATQRLHPGTLLAFPFHALGCLLVFAVVWRSALLAYRHGGIRWRDTFYALKDLRKSS